MHGISATPSRVSLKTKARNIRLGMTSPGMKKSGDTGQALSEWACVNQHIRIDHIDGRAGRISNNLIENIGELDLEFVARDVADVRRADHIVHGEQCITAVEQ